MVFCPGHIGQLEKVGRTGGGTDTAAEAYASALGSIEEPDELGRSPKSIL